MERPCPDKLFAENLKRIMDQKNLTMSEVADRAKVDRASIYGVLRANNSPTLRTCERLAAAVRVPLYRLLKEHEDE